MKTRNSKEFKSWDGDGYLDENLYDLGLVWKTINKKNQQYTFIIGVEQDDFGMFMSFVELNLSFAEWIAIIDNIGLSEFLIFCDMDRKELQKSFPYIVVKKSIDYYGINRLLTNKTLKIFRIKQ